MKFRVADRNPRSRPGIVGRNPGEISLFLQNLLLGTVPFSLQNEKKEKRIRSKSNVNGRGAVAMNEQSGN